MNAQKIFSLVMASIFVFSLLGMPAPVLAQEPTPSLSVYTGMNKVQAHNWPLGISVTLTIDDPQTSQDPDYVSTQTIGEHPDGYSFTEFSVEDFIDIKPGFFITMSGNGVAKETTVVDLSNASVDPETDILTGTYEPGINLQIFADWFSWRNVVTASDGTWSADFSQPGNIVGHDYTVDIKAGTWLCVSWLDEDGDMSAYDWQISSPPEPVFMLNIFNDSSWQGLDAWNWPLGYQVTLTVDDPDTPESLDYTETQTMHQGNNEYHFSHAEYDAQGGGFIGQPGFTITLSDGIQTKSMTVPFLTVTGYDLANDTMSGVSDPFARIRVPVAHAAGSDWAEPTIVADSEGNWVADFRVPGFVFDIQPGDGAEPQFYDSDGDHVVLRNWSVPPVIDVRFHENEILGYGWRLDTEVTMTIDDPDTSEPVDYTDTGTVVVSDSHSNQTVVQFRLWEDNFELENGQIITMSDGTTTKTHVVAVPRITGIVSQSGISQVEGLAAPSAEIWVDFKGATRHETADGTGRWLADFHVSGDEDFETQTTGIDAWNEGEARVQDEDGDLTSTNWGRGLLMLELESDGSPQQNVYIRHWPGRQPVTLLIDNPATPQSPDYTDIRPMRRWSDGSSRLTIDWTGVFDVHPGFTITVTDGYVAKSVTVPLLVITGYDLSNDTISGRSAPLTTVVVPISNSDGSAEYAERSVLADINGNWLANFAVSNNPDEVIYDVRPGDGVEAQIYDEDSDHTVLRDWSIPIEWTLKGFYQPVDMNGVYNTVKNGSTVPFKFEVFAGSIELMDTADIESFTYIQIACDTSASTDNIETTVTGGNSLRYDPVAGQFIYNWKTPKTAGACYRVTMTTTDNSSLLAYFKLK